MIDILSIKTVKIRKKVYVKKCSRCKTKFSFDYSDTVHASMYYDGVINCPVCSARNYIVLDKTRKKTVTVKKPFWDKEMGVKDE